MSILIRGMEMPTSCGLCPLRHEARDGDECYLGASLTEYQKRPYDCPLVHVPEHGDLIDRDALTAKFKEMGLGEHSLIERLFADGVYVMIDYAPTVIPADGKGIKVPTREEDK